VIHPVDLVSNGRTEISALNIWFAGDRGSMSVPVWLKTLTFTQCELWSVVLVPVAFVTANWIEWFHAPPAVGPWNCTHWGFSDVLNVVVMLLPVWFLYVHSYVGDPVAVLVLVKFILAEPYAVLLVRFVGVNDAHPPALGLPPPPAVVFSILPPQRYRYVDEALYLGALVALLLLLVEYNTGDA
jgi:hypothetical protein